MKLIPMAPVAGFFPFHKFTEAELKKVEQEAVDADWRDDSELADKLWRRAAHIRSRLGTYECVF